MRSVYYLLAVCSSPGWKHKYLMSTDNWHCNLTVLSLLVSISSLLRSIALNEDTTETNNNRPTITKCCLLECIVIVDWSSYLR